MRGGDDGSRAFDWVPLEGRHFRRTVELGLQVGRLLGEWGIPKDGAPRRVFEERMEWRRGRMCAGNSSGWKGVGIWAGRSFARS